MLARTLFTLLVTLLGVMALAACGPVPGGTLAGTVTAAPSDWAERLEDERAICEVESRPADPHSIQLDCFLYDGELYVQSHRWAFAPWWPTTSWAVIWREQPELRVRIGQDVFELHATHVTRPDERDPVLDSRGYDPIPAGIALFRFDPRGTR